jgi:hypothetical protein
MPPALLLPQHAILLTEIIDHLQLALVHPAGNRDREEPERVQNSWHVVESLLPAPEGRYRPPVSKQIQFSVHTGNPLLQFQPASITSSRSMPNLDETLYADFCPGIEHFQQWPPVNMMVKTAALGGTFLVLNRFADPRAVRSAGVACRIVRYAAEVAHDQR